ncbi:MAG: squalene/phytoene synthase family protein [Gammaproteobacteria bacterium]
MTMTGPARRKLESAPADLRFAVLFAPREQRDALTALLAVYLEIRETLHECSDPGVAGIKLAWWQEEVSLLLEHKARHPLSQHLARFVDKRPLSLQPFLEIIEAVRMDVGTPSFPHFADVELYCYRRGGALTELAALLAGAQQAITLDAARALGIGWQLANIVMQTPLHAQQGRVYFATDDLHKHGVDKHIVAGTHTDAGLKALLADYARRARAFRGTAIRNPSSTNQVLSTGWILNGLAQARLKKFAQRDYNTTAAPVELHPLSSLFTAWRSARITNRKPRTRDSVAA